MIIVIKQYILKKWLLYSFLGTYVVLVILNVLDFEVWLPSCLITRISGYSCLGCGLNTAAMHLISLDFEQAFVANPLIFVYVPLILGVIVYDFYKFSTREKSKTK